MPSSRCWSPSRSTGPAGATLHTLPAIGVYTALFVLPLAVGRKADGQGLHRTARAVHLIGLGLLIHMALDGIDCLV